VKRGDEQDLASFLEQAAQAPEPDVPHFVDKELQACLRCGVLASAQSAFMTPDQ
jgi:hypothetical protein